MPVNAPASVRDHSIRMHSGIFGTRLFNTCDGSAIRNSPSCYDVLKPQTRNGHARGKHGDVAQGSSSGACPAWRHAQAMQGSKHAVTIPRPRGTDAGSPVQSETSSCHPAVVSSPYSGSASMSDSPMFNRIEGLLRSTYMHKGTCNNAGLWDHVHCRLGLAPRRNQLLIAAAHYHQDIGQTGAPCPFGMVVEAYLNRIL
eukprot:366000-Chlamydomonas_euryale.AAC.43